jgi:hypothetical protein
VEKNLGGKISEFTPDSNYAVSTLDDANALYEQYDDIIRESTEALRKIISKKSINDLL